MHQGMGWPLSDLGSSQPPLVSWWSVCLLRYQHHNQNFYGFPTFSWTFFLSKIAGLALPWLISHASKVIVKILQARLQQYLNRELPNVQAGFRKGRGTRDQTANIRWIIKKAREFQKSIYFCFIDYAKAFVWITINWKILKDGHTRPPDLPLKKPIFRSGSNS